MTEDRFRVSRNSLPVELSDYSRWRQVDPETLTGRGKKIFLKRYEAITRYMDGEKVQTICDTVPISRPELIRLRDRCLELTGDKGEIAGFPGLIHYSHLKKYQRREKVKTYNSNFRGGRAGALELVFEKFPSIRRYLVILALKQGKKLGPEALESRIPVKAFHKKFLDLCRKKGIKGSEYPFNTKEHGKKAIGNFLRMVLEKHPRVFATVHGGMEAAMKLGSDMEVTRQYASKPLERVEFDAHKLDAIWILKLPDRFRGYIKLALERIWLLAVIEEYSRAILGYLLCTSSEYNQYDVLQCFKRAVQPWQPIDLSIIPGLEYPRGAGLPSGVLAPYRWALWRWITYDNALANVAEWVRELLRETLGCEVNAGPVWTKDHQPFIERYFATLEQNIHRLPNTTGSDPEDTRRFAPEKAALKYEMTVEELRVLTDYFIATYNTSPHEGLDYNTPMEVLERYASQEENLIRHLPEKKRQQLSWLNQRQTVTVRGNLKKGRRPYVHFIGANYSSEVLRNSPWLIGKKLTLMFDPTDEDCRQILAFLQKGAELGMLSVRGNWARSRHSLELRREIIKLKSRKQIYYEKNDDPVQVYLTFKTKEALTKKRGRGKLAKALEHGAGEEKNQNVTTQIKDENLSSTSDEQITENKYAGKKTIIL